MADLTGTTIGRYRLESLLGQGGMAGVYRAKDTRLERDVAIKIIRKEVFSPVLLEQVLKRFEREAKALARLAHPNIVNVHDYGEYRGSPYLVMQYLPGGTLKERLGRPVPWREAAGLLLPVAQALAYAHEEGVVHRDVKPSNILLAARGQPMLTDFGIAKILEGDESTALTGTGVGIGTPEYMSPEQGLGRAVDGRTDIYSLGIILYEMIAGRKPYTADTAMELLMKKLNEPLPDIRAVVPGLPDGLVDLLQAALAKEPGDRPGSMHDLAAGLGALLAGGAVVPVQTRPRREPVEETQLDGAPAPRPRRQPALALPADGSEDATQPPAHPAGREELPTLPPEPSAAAATRAGKKEPGFAALVRRRFWLFYAGWTIVSMFAVLFFAVNVNRLGFIIPGLLTGVGYWYLLRVWVAGGDRWSWLAIPVVGLALVTFSAGYWLFGLTLALVHFGLTAPLRKRMGRRYFWNILPLVIWLIPILLIGF